MSHEGQEVMLNKPGGIAKKSGQSQGRHVDNTQQRRMAGLYINPTSVQLSVP